MERYREEARDVRGAGLLHGVSPTDAVTCAGVLTVLGSVAWLASYSPARRSTRVDPIITMRAD